ncbi:faciogenital dysplasia protein [Anaeramoeba flamelloides]|uniref:Faciogenital dysplasia protein n=1 Tax=Anaeramoeba flamelloides TaxID=1746091 RepID=A0AAV7YHB9_9EUKA|nr:faciogenital dysplasia protein [Anaeramoeba flamelloides]
MSAILFPIALTSIFLLIDLFLIFWFLLTIANHYVAMKRDKLSNKNSEKVKFEYEQEQKEKYTDKGNGKDQEKESQKEKEKENQNKKSKQENRKLERVEKEKRFSFSDFIKQKLFNSWRRKTIKIPKELQLRLQIQLRRYKQQKNYSNEKKKKKIAQELLQTERTYFGLLIILQDCIMIPLREKNYLDDEQIRQFFPGVKNIINFNRIFLKNLEQIMVHYHVGTCFGPIFTKMTDFCKVYTTYVNNYMKAMNNLRQLQIKNKKLKPFIEKQIQNSSKNKTNLESIMITPIQRLPRYILLLEEIVKKTQKTHADYEPLKVSLDKMTQVTSGVNENKKLYDSFYESIKIDKLISKKSKEQHQLNLINNNRRYLQTFEIKSLNYKKRRSKMFLFNDLILICIPIKNNFMRMKKKFTIHKYMKLESIQHITSKKLKSDKYYSLILTLTSDQKLIIRFIEEKNTIGYQKQIEKQIVDNTN